jgi:hypothetical protein
MSDYLTILAGLKSPVFLYDLRVNQRLNQTQVRPHLDMHHSIAAKLNSVIQSPGQTFQEHRRVITVTFPDYE